MGKETPLGGLEGCAAVRLPVAGRVQPVPMLPASLWLTAGAARAVGRLPHLHTGV